MPARPVLVALRALGLGDLLTGLPALRALADAFPRHRLVLAAPASLAVLARWSGAVDEVAPAAPLAPLPDRLHGADIAVNLHGRGPQSHQVLSAIRPGRLLAFHHPMAPATAAFPRWRPGEHEVVRWCRMVEGFGIPADHSRLGLTVPRGKIAERARGATIVHPGAKSPERRWPAERFAAVAAAEQAAGRRVLVTGSANETELCRAVARLAGLAPSSVLAGATDLASLAGMVAAADRVVCGDTGVAHLATAVSTPSVVLFGPTPPSEWGPPEDARHRVLWADDWGLAHCGAGPDPRLLRIEVEDVLEALAAMPERPAAGARGS